MEGDEKQKKTEGRRGGKLTSHRKDKGEKKEPEG